jgi:IMP cyclohydrolase
MGMSEDGAHLVQAYGIMGRSEPSKNRVFVEEHGAIKTTAPDKTSEEMAAEPTAPLIYYRAMKDQDGIFVVSNGAQTGYVLNNMMHWKDLEKAVQWAPVLNNVDLSRYEPDAPNLTPRINGVIDLRAHVADDETTRFGLTVVRRAENSVRPVYSSYYATSIESLPPGVGYGVHTYNGNGDPLPSFDQPPVLFELGSSAETVARDLWQTLNPAFRAAVAVRFIDVEAVRVDDQALIA